MPKPPIPETKNCYAVCVGVNQYSPSAMLPHLRYAEADAQAVFDLLRTHNFAEEHCRLLTGAEATTDAIEDALKTLLLTKPRSDDLVIFYFAGHGLLISQPDEDEAAEAPCEVFLVPQDFDRQQIEQDRGAWLECPLRIGNLRSRFFEHTRSKKVLFLLDSCHSGDVLGSAYRDGESLAQHYIAQAFATKSAGRVVLSSCMPQQKAREDADLKHGVFTYHLLEALEGHAPEAARMDGWVTVSSLFDYLSDKLPEQQRPVESGVKHGTFQLLYYPEYAKQVTPATNPSSEDERKQEREERLKALLIDHSGFMRNRLDSFVGREQELAELRQRIHTMLPTGGYITITGQAGQGKSSIIARLVQEYTPDKVAHHFIPFNPGPDYQVNLLRDLMAQLILKHALSDLYVASESRPALRDYFPKVLAEIAAKGQQELIFIDGLDQLLADANEERDLSFLPNNPPEGVVFVLGTRPNDTLRPLELRKPHQTYKLPNLSRHDFDLMLQHRNVQLGKVLADQFYKAMQENALYLDLVAKELSQDGTAKPEEIIRRVADDPDNIFYLSTTRLKRQTIEWREVLKPLLGVLLVAREPLAVRHIRHILELDDERLREGLVRLGGLIADDGRQRYSLFHLKLYDYLRQNEHLPAKEYIFATDEEEGWHKRLANWCERGGIATLREDLAHDPAEQGRREYARQHYIAHLYAARAWQQLFEVLDAGVYGRAKLHYDPSTRLYAQDLDLGRQAAAWEGWTLEEGLERLPHLWRYTLLRCSLASRADRYPEAAFGLLVLLKRKQEALGLAELLTDPARKTDVLLQIAAQIGEQAGQEREGLEILLRVGEIARTISESNRRAVALSALGTSLAQTQQWERAQAVIDTIQDSDTHARALSTLGTALAQAQQWEPTQAVIGSIQDSDTHARALSTLGTALAQAQLWEQAAEVWTQAQAVIGTIQDSYWRAEALSALATALAQTQQWERAQAVIDTIQDSYWRAEALSTLAVALAQTQLWEQAAEVWTQAQTMIDTIQYSYWQARALRALGTSLTQTQQWERAQAVMDTIQDSYWRAEALSTLAVALAQTQLWEQAAEVWTQAQAVIDTIQYSDTHARALSALGTALAQAQQWEQAKAVIGTIQNGRRRAVALSALATALAQAQQWEQAKAVIGTIQDSNRQAEALSTLATALAQAQLWEQAKAVIDTIGNRDERARGLWELAAKMAVAGDYGQLLSLIQRSWWQAGTRENALDLFPMATGFIPQHPELGLAFHEGFTWVNGFLKG